MIDPNNFESVSPKVAPRSEKPQLSVSSKAMNLNYPLVEQLIKEGGELETTASGSKRLYVNLEYSRVDKAFRVTRGTAETGFLFLLQGPRHGRPTDRPNASRGIPSNLNKMGVVRGVYVPKLSDQPDIFVIEVRPAPNK